MLAFVDLNCLVVTIEHEWECRELLFTPLYVHWLLRSVMKYHFILRAEMLLYKFWMPIPILMERIQWHAFPFCSLLWQELILLYIYIYISKDFDRTWNKHENNRQHYEIGNCRNFLKIYCDKAKIDSMLDRKRNYSTNAKYHVHQSNAK